MCRLKILRLLKTVIEYEIEFSPQIHDCGENMEIIDINFFYVKFVCNSCKQKFDVEVKDFVCPFCNDTVSFEKKWCQCGKTYFALSSYQVLDDDDAKFYDQEINSVYGQKPYAEISESLWTRNIRPQIVTEIEHKNLIFIPVWNKNERGYFYRNKKNFYPGRGYLKPNPGIHRIVYEKEEFAFVLPVEKSSFDGYIILER